MPVDPQVARLLAQLAAADLPPYTELSPQQARAAYLAVVQARRGPGYLPEPVGSVRELTVPGPAGELPCRLYLPAAAGPWPQVVFLHGGGWVTGSVETHDNQARAESHRCGVAVLSVDYRLAPEHPYPAALDDAYAATGWAAEQAGSWGADANRLAVAGDSAGGNLAAAVCLAARDRAGPRLAGQLLVYPAVDASMSMPSVRENGQGYYLTADTMRWFTEGYLPDPALRGHPYASPLDAPDLAGLPPAVVVTAELDPLRDEGEAYAARLRAAGVPVVLRRFDGLIHGFFGMGPVVAAAEDAIGWTCAAFREWLVPANGG